MIIDEETGKVSHGLEMMLPLSFRSPGRLGPFMEVVFKLAETQEAEKSQSDFFLPSVRHVPDDDIFPHPHHVPDDDIFLRPHHVPDDDIFLRPHHVPDDDIFLRPRHVPDDDIFLHPFHHVPDDDFFLRPFHHVPDDSNLIPIYSPKYQKRGVPHKAEERRASLKFVSYGMAALGLSLLTFTAGMCPVSGTMCDGQAMAVSKGKVAIVCPLTSDLHQTEERSVIIKHFIKQSSRREDVLSCEWLASRQNFTCSYKFGAQLIDAFADRILASLPKDRLGNGTYHCHLVPPDKQTFTQCVICDPDDLKNVAITDTSKALPTTTTTLNLPKSGADEYGGRLVTAVVVLSIAVLCLLVVIVILVFCLHKLRKKIKKYQEKDTEEENSHLRPGGGETQELNIRK